MTFFNHLASALSYLFDRSYMIWFFSVPAAGALVYLVTYILSFKGDRTK